MLEIYACTLVILAASLLLGGAIVGALGWRAGGWLAGATGFAVLVTITPFLIRLPGRGTTAAIVIGLVLVACAHYLWRHGSDLAERRAWLSGALAVFGVVALASIPFALADRTGVLGEGIYTNDHAAQLYWTDWLQHGFGPEPSAVSFGYPIGPQALTAIVADLTGADLIAAFNGLLIAIAALTALTALAALRRLRGGVQIGIAVLCGLPYLGASFLAQSGFKETAMALFVLAFAIALAGLSGPPRDRDDPLPARAVLVIGLILAAASVFTFSLPGLAWFGIAIPLWLGLETIAGRHPLDYRWIVAALARHRALTAIGVLIALAVAAVAIGPASSFLDRVDDVSVSIGRLGSPIFPGEVFGIWPAGDFRIVRGEVSGSLIATAIGFLAAAYGAWVLLARRQFALLAMLGAGAVVYVGARLFAEIHVEAKALAVIAPLVLLIALRALFEPDSSGAAAGSSRLRLATPVRYALGGVVALAALGSTLLALRAAPVGFDDRGASLERLAERAEGEPVIFLGLDRFAGYWLRETLARAPGGYVPQEIDNRPEKPWQQGLAVDWDNLDSRKLDKFRYAVTTSAAYQSAPPANFERVAGDGDYVLWRRQGETPRSRVIEGEGGDPGVDTFCITRAGEPADPTILASTFLVTPATGGYEEWQGTEPVEDAVGGQELGFAAPATATNRFELPEAGEYNLSLQYQSQVPLEVSVDGERVASLPPSLEGMYLDGAGRGAFWAAGSFDGEAGPAEVEVRAQSPGGLAETFGAERRVWLGKVAATSAADPVERELPDLCGYIDHYRKLRGKGKS